MLKCESLSFQYTDGPSFSFPDIQCEQGEHLLLLGESGKGKTTLLHLLAGMLRPTQGSVTVADTNIVGLRAKELDRFRGKHIGIIFQTAHFVQSLSVEDNLILPQFFSGSKIDRAKAKAILDRLNIGDKAKSKPKDLSIGEQQRAAIARALVNDPDILLADEPTSALDDKNAAEVIQLLEEQSSLSNAALIIVTHDQRLKDRFQKQVTL